MKIQIKKYASGYYGTSNLPGQMFKSQEELIKTVKKAAGESRQIPATITIFYGKGSINTGGITGSLAIGNASITLPEQVIAELLDTYPELKAATGLSGQQRPQYWREWASWWARNNAV